MNLSNDFNQHELLKIKSADDIKTAELVNEFSDGNIPCADALINNIEVALYFCGSKVIGALEYSNESPSARQAVFDALQSETSVTISSMFDLSDGELSNEVMLNRSAYKHALEYVRESGRDSSIWSEVAGYFETESNLVNIETMSLK